MSQGYNLNYTQVGRVIMTCYVQSIFTKTSFTFVAVTTVDVGAT